MLFISREPGGLKTNLILCCLLAQAVELVRIRKLCLESSFGSLALLLDLSKVVVTVADCTLGLDRKTSRSLSD